MSHLTVRQRYEISVYRQEGMSAIAEKIGTNKSTISRELARNSDGRSGRYRAEQITGHAKTMGLPCVSPERIYRFVWQDKKQGGTLYTHLRTMGKK